MTALCTFSALREWELSFILLMKLLIKTHSLKSRSGYFFFLWTREANTLLGLKMLIELVSRRSRSGSPVWKDTEKISICHETSSFELWMCNLGVSARYCFAYSYAP